MTHLRYHWREVFAFCFILISDIFLHLPKITVVCDFGVLLLVQMQVSLLYWKDPAQSVMDMPWPPNAKPLSAASASYNILHSSNCCPSPSKENLQETASQDVDLLGQNIHLWRLPEKILHVFASGCEHRHWALYLTLVPISFNWIIRCCFFSSCGHGEILSWAPFLEEDLWKMTICFLPCHRLRWRIVWSVVWYGNWHSVTGSVFV